MNNQQVIDFSKLLSLISWKDDSFSNPTLTTLLRNDEEELNVFSLGSVLMVHLVYADSIAKPEELKVATKLLAEYFELTHDVASSIIESSIRIEKDSILFADACLLFCQYTNLDQRVHFFGMLKKIALADIDYNNETMKCLLRLGYSLGLNEDLIQKVLGEDYDTMMRVLAFQ